ncbi:uncharacterized protein PAC_02558 [Phialocephala subalpina]|uniref:Uncharacterized protein n=1 Tax=Phialocephala subalpina TaxID=576137 RepID=A0A1L7WIT3_9HELO|nr:uncharacterized protein PAC_02558 [Phialocephala subalpina]
MASIADQLDLGSISRPNDPSLQSIDQGSPQPTKDPPIEYPALIHLVFIPINKSDTTWMTSYKPNSSCIISIHDDISLRELQLRIQAQKLLDAFEIRRRVHGMRLVDPDGLPEIQIVWQDNTWKRIPPLKVMSDEDLKLMGRRGKNYYIQAKYTMPRVNDKERVTEAATPGNGQEGGENEGTRDGVTEQGPGQYQQDGHDDGNPDEGQNGEDDAPSRRRAAVPRQGPTFEKKRKRPEAIDVAEGQPTFTRRGRPRGLNEGGENDIDESDADEWDKKRRKTEKQAEKGKGKGKADADKAEKLSVAAVPRRSERHSRDEGTKRGSTK